MTKSDSKKYAMFRLVREVLEKNEKIYAEIPSLIKTIQSFNEGFDEIAVIDESYASVPNGITHEKSVYQKKLMDSMTGIAGLLYLLGKKNNDENLKTFNSINQTFIRYLRSDEFINIANNIFKNSNTYINELKIMYSSIESDIKDLEQNINKYKTSVNKKDIKQSEKHILRTSLEKAFKNTDELLKDEIDRFVELLKAKYPDFYEQYKDARNIKVTPGKKRKKEDEIN